MRTDNELIDVFADNYEKLSKLAIMILEDKVAALDVMQNVALIIVTKAYKLQEIEKPIAFLLTCVRRAALNYIRNESRSYPTDPAMIEEMQGDDYSHIAIDYLEWAMLLEKYLVSYSTELQNAFIKHYIDGHPLEKIADETHMTPNALSQQFRRMRKDIARKSPKLGMLIAILTYL